MTSASGVVDAVCREALRPSALPDVWSGVLELERAVRELQDRFDGVAPVSIQTTQLEEAIRALMADAPLSLKQIRLCCERISVAVNVDGHDLAISDVRLLTDRLIEQWRRLPPVATKRIAGALIRGLLAVPHTTHPSATRNLAVLTRELYMLTDTGGRAVGPVVAELAERLRPVLVDRDVTALVPAVLAGRDELLADLERLNVPQESWVWAALADRAASVAEGEPEALYREVVPSLVSWLAERQALLEPGLGRVIRHLAKGRDRSEIPVVRELALERWGNPHLQSNHARWRAAATEEGRQLVASWVARHVIDVFFNTLTAHGDPQQRATYWSRKAELIDELWVYGGRMLAEDRRKETRMLRTLLGSRLLRLTDEDETSMFVMRVRDYYFAEFSTTGNALYIYRRRDLPAPLGQDLDRAASFKDSDRGERVPHVGQWQRRVNEFIAGIAQRGD